MIIKPGIFRETPESADTPLSAGTYSYEVCDICIDADGNQTAITIDAPHPTYTNGNGKAVVQLQMVEIGGINGLNS